MSGNSDFGYELLNRLYENQINKKEDVLILIIHWYFLKNGFRCIGLGDSRTFSSTEKGSELLPEGWNQELVYKLRYLKENKLYIIIGAKSDADLVINFMKVDDTASSSLLLSVEDIVKALRGPLGTQIPNYPEVLNKIKNDLLEPVYRGDSKSMSTQTSNTPSSTQYFLRDPVPGILPPRSSLRHDLGFPIRPGVGRDDLDPLGRLGGGGMLYNPTGGYSFNSPDGESFMGIPGRIPHGAVPPGARFDPFGPPRSGFPEARRNPDNNIPPPEYDDMFM